MRLDVGGQPLHTRALAVTLLARADGRLDVRGELVDLRKRCFVPVGGDLQGPGVIHHMLLDGVVDPAGARLVEVRAEQPAVAFEPSALSAGESCRDPIDRIRAVAGAPLDGDFARAVGAAVGGPRGCSHILALGHLLGATAAWALGVAGPRLPAYRPGERVFRRDLVVDGYDTGPGRLALAAQLTDLHFAPAPPIAPPMDRFAGAYELRMLANLDFAGFALTGVTGAERRRGPSDPSPAWRSRDEALAPLAGLGLAAGVTAALLARYPAPDDRPLLDALLALAPTLVQCMAALADSLPATTKGVDPRVGLGGLPDSCYMWRRDGALARARQ